jgi:hypothetical protein
MSLSGFHKQNVISELSEKLNLFACLSKYDVIKTYGEVEIQLHSFPTSTMDALFYSHVPNETCCIISQLLPFTESLDPFHISSHGLAHKIMSTNIPHTHTHTHKSRSCPPHEDE